MKSLHPIVVAVLAVLLLLPGLAYISLRLTLPGDASSPMVTFLRIQPGKLTIHPISPVSQGLQNGDIVTAIQGQGIDQYIQGLFSSQKSSNPAGRLQYTVLRGDQTLQVDSTTKPLSLPLLFNQNWSIYVYLIYLLLISLLVFILRPRAAAAQLFFVISCAMLSSGLAVFPGLKVDDLLTPWLVILFLWGAVVLYGLFLAAGMHLLLIFPKPNPFLVQHPRILWPIYLGPWFLLLAYIAAPWSIMISPAARLVLIVQSTALISIIYYPLLLLTTVSSYRAGNLREKRQIRWLLWSLMISLIPYLVFSAFPSLIGMQAKLATFTLGLLWCTVPTSFAIAILHERLFDIDVIIRRTLIYSALTLTLGAVYFASILLLQGFFQVFTQHQSPLATVLSTLMTAILFNPLRGRIQKDIDRRFYRRKYDIDQTLREFAHQLRNEMNIEKITEELKVAVGETMEPQNLSLWIPKSKSSL